MRTVTTRRLPRTRGEELPLPYPLATHIFWPLFTRGFFVAANLTLHYPSIHPRQSSFAATLLPNRKSLATVSAV